jgi:hypothetical protein
MRYKKIRDACDGARSVAVKEKIHIQLQLNGDWGMVVGRGAREEVLESAHERAGESGRGDGIGG